MDYIKKLKKASENWNTEEHKYICLDWKGAVYFTNDLDCNGNRHWNKKSLQKHIDRIGRN